MQIIGSKKYEKDLEKLKIMLSYEEQPSKIFLKNGLEILLTTDLRTEENNFNVPFLRIYGSLDNLVPKKISEILDKKWTKSTSVIIKEAAHLPFLSHKKKFCDILIEFTKKI